MVQPRPRYVEFGDEKAPPPPYPATPGSATFYSRARLLSNRDARPPSFPLGTPSTAGFPSKRRYSPPPPFTPGRLAGTRGNLPLSSTFLETWGNKLLPLLALGTTTIFSTILLGLNMSSWTSTRALVQIQNSYSSLIPGVVQTTAEVLASLQLYALFTLLNFATSIQLCQSTSSLDSLKYRAAIILRKLDITLPSSSMVLVFLLYLFSKAPAFIWANSITILSTTTSTTVNLTLPIFGNDPFVHNDFASGDLPGCWILSPNMSAKVGVYGSCPGQMFFNNILLDASTATSKTHYRTDNITALYTGRSYGIGAAVGLSDTFFNAQDLVACKPGWGEFSFLNPNLLEYTYQESGFETTVTCKQNPSSTSEGWRLYQVEPENPSENLPGVYEANGTLGDDSANGFYSTWGINGTSQIAVWAATNNTGSDYSNSLSIVAGSDYQKINNTICDINFNPTVFNVSVFTGTNIMGNISVTPTEIRDSGLATLDADWHLRTLVLEQLTAISAIGSTLHGSVLGDALMTNINVCTLHDPSETKTMDCLASSVEQIIDDLFVLLLAGQLVKQMAAMQNSNNWTWPADQFHSSPIKATWIAAQFGTRPYVVINFWLNFLYLVIWGLEAYRWAFWKDLPTFNIMDIKSAILASSFGGQSIARAVEEVEDERQTPWIGEGDDPKVGRIRVQFVTTELWRGTRRLSLRATAPESDYKETWIAEWCNYFRRPRTELQEKLDGFI